ncbi:uncharacterized protein K02A2.6-like [Octopus sinensis]|uniref:Uncharacterized protein K02A2.6-like n=1 Tax=Octopus sinensis TaxID=2607531 RepID=A0A6P7T968_9MOLL|nr:uncharacterized protein K02A2.6-like [Octopus sinensis]
MGWAYVPNISNILVIVDACSTWIEAFLCPNRSAETVKSKLLEVFARFGVPTDLVSDNGPEFLVLGNMLSSMGCRKIEALSYSPASNGAAERAIQTVKAALKHFDLKTRNFGNYLNKILFNHQSPLGGCKLSPARKLMKRPLRVAANHSLK